MNHKKEGAALLATLPTSQVSSFPKYSTCLAFRLFCLGTCILSILWPSTALDVDPSHDIQK